MAAGVPADAVAAGGVAVKQAPAQKKLQRSTSAESESTTVPVLLRPASSGVRSKGSARSAENRGRASRLGSAACCAAGLEQPLAGASQEQ